MRIREEEHKISCPLFVENEMNVHGFFGDVLEGISLELKAEKSNLLDNHAGEDAFQLCWIFLLIFFCILILNPHKHSHIYIYIQ